MLFREVTREDILKELEADKASHVWFLQKFIRAKSPNPPGDTLEAAQVVADYLSSHNIPYETWSLRDDLPNIVADFSCDFSQPRPHAQESDNEETRRLVMNGHMDVFPVSKDDRNWHRDPWSGDVDEEYVYGRGVVDMKAGTAVSVIAYRYLYQLYQKQQVRQRQLTSPIHHSSPSPTTTSPHHPSPSLAITVVSDEETGGEYGSKWLLSDSRGEDGGGGNRWKGTVMLNAEPGGLQSIRFGEKGTLRLTFHIHTLSCHGAYLNLSEGAIRISTRLISSLLTIEDLPYPSDPSRPDLEELKRHMEKPKVKKVVDQIMGPGASSIIMKPTVNIGIIAGGAKVNMIPGDCRVEVDIRIPIGMTRAMILTHITKTILPHFPGVRMEIQEAASNPPSRCPIAHPLVDLLRQNAVFIGERKMGRGTSATGADSNLGEENVSIAAGPEGKRGLTGFAPLSMPGMGATDCKFWRYTGIPAYTYGVSPKTMASTDERVEIEEFLDVLKTHVLSAWEFLGGGD